MSYPKERRFRTYGSRWGVGKVHRLLYSQINKTWYFACQDPGNPGTHRGERVPDNTVHTCKKC